jgi:hypothetical protein
MNRSFLPKASLYLTFGTLLLSTLLWSGGAFAVQATPSDDSFLGKGVNKGDKQELRVGGVVKYESFIKFDLTTVPEDVLPEEVLQATLRLYPTKVLGDGFIDVLPVSSDWSEGSGVGFPPSVENTPAASFQVSSADELDYVHVDVTSLVKDWLDDDALRPNYGIALIAGASENTNVYFDSKESGGTSHDPGLEIVFGSVGPQGDTGPQGPPGNDGVSGYTIVTAQSTEFVAAGKTGLIHYFALCPEGKQVTGGGVRPYFEQESGLFTPHDIHIEISRPLMVPAPPGWEGFLYGMHPSSSWTIEVYAICVTALP